MYVGISEKFVGGLRRPVRFVSNVGNLKKNSNFIDFHRIYGGLRRPFHNFRCHLGQMVVSVVYVDNYDNSILRSGGLRRPDLLFSMKIS